MQRDDRALGEQESSCSQNGQRSSVDDPGHERWTSVTQQALVQNGEKGGQDGGNERQGSSHDESFSLQKGYDYLSVYHIKKRCTDRSYVWCSGENRVGHSQVVDMGQSSGSSSRSMRGKHMESQPA